MITSLVPHSHLNRYQLPIQRRNFGRQFARCVNRDTSINNPALDLQRHSRPGQGQGFNWRQDRGFHDQADRAINSHIRRNHTVRYRRA